MSKNQSLLENLSAVANMHINSMAEIVKEEEIPAGTPCGREFWKHIILFYTHC